MGQHSGYSPINLSPVPWMFASAGWITSAAEAPEASGPTCATSQSTLISALPRSQVHGFRGNTSVTFSWVLILLEASHRLLKGSGHRSADLQLVQRIGVGVVRPESATDVFTSGRPCTMQGSTATAQELSPAGSPRRLPGLPIPCSCAAAPTMTGAAVRIAADCLITIVPMSIPRTARSSITSSTILIRTSLAGVSARDRSHLDLARSTLQLGPATRACFNAMPCLNPIDGRHPGFPRLRYRHTMGAEEKSIG